MKTFMKFFFNCGILGLVISFSIAMLVHGIVPIFTFKAVLQTAAITFFESGLLCGSMAVLNGWK